MGEGGNNLFIDKIKAFLKKLAWQDCAFVGLLILYLVFQINLLSSFKQLPSPIYGGDYYYSMGTVQHVMSGGNPFASSNVLGSEPGYLPSYAILAAVPGILFSLSVLASMKIFAIIEMIAALVVFYLFASYLLKNKSLALISVLAYLPLISFPVFKYMNLTYTLMLPAFLFSLFYFFNKRNLVSAIIAGILFGIVGLSHTVGFVVAVLFFLTFSLYFLVLEHLQKEGKKWFFEKKLFSQAFLKKLKLLIIIGLIGSAIAMLFWFKPIFVYHAQLPAASVHMHDLSSSAIQLSTIWQTFKLFFFNFSDIFTGIVTFLFIIGFVSIFFLKKYDLSKKFLIIILITAFIASFHFIISEPLLGMNVFPDQMRYFSFNSVCALFAAFGAGVISGFAKKYKIYVLMTLMILLLAFNIQAFISYSNTDKWVSAGRTPLSLNLAEMRDWVLKNTAVNDVFLSTNELSFALNSLTGRKEVIGRRAHNSMFLDTNKKQVDAAIMLYSNDTEERKRLLKEYSVDYLYWDYYWIQSDYYFDDSGKLSSWFDPIILLDTPEYEALMTKHNISFFKQHTWVDPAVKGPDMAQFDLLFILPYQFNLTHPWHPDLDNYLEEVWTYAQGGVLVSRIYKIVNTS